MVATLSLALLPQPVEVVVEVITLALGTAETAALAAALRRAVRPLALVYQDKVSQVV
jgi:hypothetical protein